MCHTGDKSGGRLQKIFLDPPPPELLVRSDVLTGSFQMVSPKRTLCNRAQTLEISGGIIELLTSNSPPLAARGESRG